MWLRMQQIVSDPALLIFLSIFALDNYLGIFDALKLHILWGRPKHNSFKPRDRYEFTLWRSSNEYKTFHSSLSPFKGTFAYR